MTKNNQGTDRKPHAITRLTRTQTQDLCQKIHATVNGDLPAAGSRRLGLYQSTCLVLASLRHNLGQEVLAELFGISQPTVSRVLASWTPLIAAALADNVPTADGLDPDTQLIIDGTLIPCWAWRDKPELYSGKHHTTRVNLQVACTLTGHLAWVSTPMPGRTHDARALTESGLLHPNSDSQSNDSPRYPLTRHIADKGYIGLGLITPPPRNTQDFPNPRPTRTTTGPSTKSDGQSNKPSQTSKPGTPSKPVTGAPSTPSQTPSQQYSESSSPTPYE